MSSLTHEIDLLVVRLNNWFCFHGISFANKEELKKMPVYAS